MNNIIRNAKDLEKLQDFISDNKKIGFDIETTGLQPRTDKIIGFGFSNADEGYYIVHLEWNTETKQLEERVPLSACIEILELLKHRQWVGWNSSFEVRFVRHYCGIDLAPSLHSEGMLAVHTVDENRMSYKLKDIGAELFGAEALDEQTAMKESIKANGGNPSSDYFMADADLMGEYCIMDCKLTFKIDAQYLKSIHGEGLSDFYFNREVMPLYSEVTIPMEDRGIKLDLELILKSRIQITEDINILHAKIQKAIEPYLDLFKEWYLNKELPPKRTGEFAQMIAKFAKLDLPLTKSGRFSLGKANLEKLEHSIYKDFLLGGEYLPDSIVKEIQRLWWSEKGEGYMFNISSKDHLKKLFFTKLDESPVSKTKKGNPQVDHLFLMEMGKKYEWVNDLIDYNKLNKIRSTYMDRFLERHLDGVLYPSWFQHRTVSGRYSGDLQQLPRPKEEGELSPVVLKYNNLIRKFFISREGYSFIDSDYESLEPHVFASVSGDKKLQEIFHKGEDFYSGVAINMYGLDGVSADKKADNYLGKVNKPLRQKSKAIALGIPYGLESYALSKQLDIGQDEAQKLIDDYLNAFPDLKRWMENTFEELITQGRIESKAGRVRHFPSAPKVWYAHKAYILDNLKLWKKYHELPKKYQQMKYLAKQFKNWRNNSYNVQIQSLASSICNRAAIAINRELKRQNIKGQVVSIIHDQIVVEIEDKHAEKFAKTMEFLMCNVFKLDVKLKSPACVAKDFFEGH